MNALSGLSVENEARRLGLRRYGNEWHGPCPNCGAGKDRFRLTRSGKLFCRVCCPDGRDKDAFRQLLKAAGFDVPERREEDPEAQRARRKAEKAQADREARKIAERHEAVARDARSMIEQASPDTHPYLAAKGFPEHRALVFEETLLIPMYPIEAYRGGPASIQQVQPDGSKKFLPGGRAKGCVHHLGQGREHWWCEGYATALSLRSALARIHRSARVTVCFSASNLSHVAKRGFVVADHDAHGVGEREARKSGLPYWMPPDEGMDANDFHLQHGISALATELRGLILA